MLKHIYILLVFIFSLSLNLQAQEAVIIDHNCADISKIPDTWILEAKGSLRIGYGHTSHGSQLVTGIDAYRGDQGSIYYYSYSSWGLETSKFLNDYWGNEGGANDLGHNGNLEWRDATVCMLNLANNDRNVVIWSWCGGVSDNTQAGIKTYLDAMSALEYQYPDVTFVYMTGHLDGSGVDGNLNKRNNQIRDYCEENNKFLFDFADIESYDPDGNYYLNKGADDSCLYNGGNWAEEWLAANPISALADWVYQCGSCAHSQRLNCVLKGGAFWWLMARIAGWEGNSEQRTLQVISPNGGENWLVGSRHNITWMTQGEVGRVKIAYSTDDEENWKTIVSSTKNDGIYHWVIPDGVSADCLVRLSEKSGTLVDISDNSFEIISTDEPPSVMITYPANNSEVKDSVTVQAIATDDFGIRKVEFFVNGILHHRDTAAPFKYVWDTTVCPSGSYTITATATDTNGQQDSYAISVTVRNINLSMQASRGEERAWLVQRQYGKIELSAGDIGSATVSKYIIYRKEAGGTYNIAKEIEGSNAPGGMFVYYDKYLERTKTYLYRAVALGTNGQILTSSNEETV